MIGKFRALRKNPITNQLIYPINNKYKMNNDNVLKQIKQSRLQQAQTIIRNKQIKYKGYTMRFEYFLHGEKPPTGYRLVLGFHGGGNCPFEVNQQQWNNHKHLYDDYLPSGTIWFVPRSPQQASDMWWKWYIPDFVTLIIQCFSVMNMIDTNKVFLTGYSAGGDGIYHVAAMMADLLAGASMMAGHPNQADCYNLRNLTFSVQAGDQDHAYDRANWAKVYIDKLQQLSKQYGGFKQFSKVHQNSKHWMDKKDAIIFSKLFQQVRNPYPQFILFRQHPRTFKKTFYYLKLDQKHNGLIAVRKKGNVFQIQSEQMLPVKIMLNSQFVDFSKQVEIYHNGDLTVKAQPKKSKDIINETAGQFVDPWFIFEEELISIPTKNLPKDYKILRPYDKQHSESSSQRIKQMQQNIKQDEKLHVSFNLKDRNIIEPSIHSSEQVIEVRQHYHRNPGSFSRKLKRLQQACNENCQIY